MGKSRQTKTALGLGLVSGLVVLACAAVLIVEYTVAAGRAPEEKTRVEELEEQTGSDAAVAEELHAEREKQTGDSIVRRDLGRNLGWVLLIAGSAFVASGKWYVSLRPQPQPPLDELVAVRFPPSTPAKRKRSGKPPVVAPPEEEAIDLAFVDGLVQRFGRSSEAAIPILQAIQTHYRYLPDEALHRVCELTEITPAQIAGTSSFYSQFRSSPVGRYVVRVCHGTACHVAGADQITQELRRHLEIPDDEDTDSRRLFTMDKVACLGCCSLAPVMMVEDETAGHLTPASARQALDDKASES